MCGERERKQIKMEEAEEEEKDMLGVSLRSLHGLLNQAILRVLISSPFLFHLIPSPHFQFVRNPIHRPKPKETVETHFGKAGEQNIGATLGALTGAFVGAKTKMGCLHGAMVGAIKGSFFSINLFKISLRICRSDDISTTYLLQPVSVFYSTFNEVIRNELSKDSMAKIPKTRITEQNVWDSFRNRISCSICLEDFTPGEIAHSLPQCHHMFHTS
ncbi:NEP1-interacting protein 1 isoform X3 [Gossypium hirsutum]|uniref:NEP1-interacting protein 1 isoform X3 n=1 Tax=Gossypium hirsutum TaxID=3635 RepID=A0ABM3A531_GOSHI|nr:NEP1-interacting protein 1-like isoform X3 [Gossypium hirsutum]